MNTWEKLLPDIDTLQMDLVICPICHCAVPSYYRNHHMEWHDRLAELIPEQKLSIFR